ncbi:MAG: thioesterase domain-containing protein, partial [Methylococcus sp.]
ERRERAAEQVLAEIIAQQSEVPCILIGFSWAGILAYETAWQMISTAKFPLILILLDSLAPVRRFGLTEGSLHFVRYLPRRTLRLGLKGWLRLFKNVMNFSEPEPRSTTVERHFSDLVLQYGAPQVPWLDIHLIRMDEAVWRKKVGPLSEVSLLWRDYGWHRISTGKVYVYQVRCQEHSDMLREPNCKDVAGLIRKVASTLESPNP